MYPEALDIAVPPFPPDTEWVGGEPKAVERLCAQGPVLVHFICAGDLSSVRTLPYLQTWRDRYAAHSLTVLGVNTPRFPYTADPSKLSAALSRLGVTFPVALDARRAIWRDYGSYGWPSLFLWGRGGALRWYHFGEGEYAATENAIQELVREVDALATLPEPMAPLRAGDAPGALIVPPTQEVFPDSSAIEVDYGAGGVAVSVDGIGELRYSIDDGDQRTEAVASPGVYELATHPAHESHRLALNASAGVRLHAVSFIPGTP